jgi:hypothetical protein
MDSRKSEIKQNESDISGYEEKITAECILIGKRIAELDRHPVRNGECLKYLNNVDSLRRSIEKYQEDINIVQLGLRRKGELADQLAENRKRAKDLQEERETRFVELGAASYTVFKRMADPAPYRSIFEELLRLDADMDRLHGELKDLGEQEKDKGFFEKLFRYKGKKFSVRSNLSKAEKEKIKTFEEVGRRIVESDFAKQTTGDLRTIFDLDADKDREAKRIAEEDRETKNELEKVTTELLRYGIEEYGDDKIAELEKRIEDVRRELEVMYCWTGQLYMERDLRTELPDSTLVTKFDAIVTIRDSIRRKQQRTYRLKAEMEIEELTRKEKSFRQRKRLLEEEMRTKERQIGVIDLELTTGQRRLEELKRILTGEVPYTEPSPLPPTPDFYTEKNNLPEEEKEETPGANEKTA